MGQPHNLIYRDNSLESLQETDKGFTCREQSPLDVLLSVLSELGAPVSFLYFLGVKRVGRW